jgi:hypothetical protein
MHNLFGELTFVNELFTFIYPSINRTSHLWFKNINMSQQKMITSFISTASVQKVSENVPKSISSENIESSQDVVFEEGPPNVKLNISCFISFFKCITSLPMMLDRIFSISSLFTTLSKVVLIVSNSFSIHRGYMNVNNSLTKVSSPNKLYM